MDGAGAQEFELREGELLEGEEFLGVDWLVGGDDVIAELGEDLGGLHVGGGEVGRVECLGAVRSHAPLISGRQEGGFGSERSSG